MGLLRFTYPYSLVHDIFLNGHAVDFLLFFVVPELENFFLLGRLCDIELSFGPVLYRDVLGQRVWQLRTSHKKTAILLKFAFFAIDTERSNGVLSKFFIESLDEPVQHVAAKVDFGTFAVIIFLIVD